MTCNSIIWRWTVLLCFSGNVWCLVFRCSQSHWRALHHRHSSRASQENTAIDVLLGDTALRMSGLLWNADAFWDLSFYIFAVLCCLLFLRICTRFLGHAVAQLDEAPRNKSEGCGFDSRLPLKFYIDNPSGLTMALGSTEPLTEMSTRNISWGVDAASAEGWQPYHLYMCMSIILKSGSLNFLETTGPVQACNEIVTNRFLNLSGVFPHLYCGLIVNCVKFSPPPLFLDYCPQLRLVCARSYVLQETSLLGYTGSTGKWSRHPGGACFLRFFGSFELHRLWKWRQTSSLKCR